MRTRSPFELVNEALELDSGDGHTTLNVLNAPELCT